MIKPSSLIPVWSYPPPVVVLVKFSVWPPPPVVEYAEIDLIGIDEVNLVEVKGCEVNESSKLKKERWINNQCLGELRGEGRERERDTHALVRSKRIVEASDEVEVIFLRMSNDKSNGENGVRGEVNSRLFNSMQRRELTAQCLYSMSEKIRERKERPKDRGSDEWNPESEERELAFRSRTV